VVPVVGINEFGTGLRKNLRGEKTLVTKNSRNGKEGFTTEARRGQRKANQEKGFSLKLRLNPSLNL
jgi:hypothetical protein